MLDNEYIIRKQAWEDYQEYLVEQEELIILDQLNKVYNKKGYTLTDYKEFEDNLY